MANVRVIAVEEDNRTLEQLAVLNTLTLVNPEQSMWEKTSAGDLRVGDSLFGNHGSWSLKIATDVIDPPPQVEWEYNSATSDVISKISTNKYRAPLLVRNLELVPTPADNYPDTYWTRNGQDLIPRS